MATTNDDRLAERIRLMSLHGISKDAWKRFTSEGSWYYEITEAGYKYNMTDIAAAIGLHQLRKADRFRQERERVAELYRAKLGGMEELILPTAGADRIHSWHLFPIRLRLSAISIDRANAIDALKAAGIGSSVHWMPLHLHPYYRQTYGFRAEDFPVSNRLFWELISLPIYPSMTDEEVGEVCAVLSDIISRNRRRATG